MQQRSHIPVHIRWITLLVLALVFGHDLLMVTAPHAQMDAHTDHVVMQQCGPTEGVLSQNVVLPPAHPPAAFLSCENLAPNQLVTSFEEDQVEMLADASVRRAMLQVFLN